MPLLGGHVPHEQPHPLRQRQVGGHGLQELVRPLAEDVDLVAIDRLHQRLARREVSIEGADADARISGDVLERDVGAAGGEGIGGR